LSCSDDEIPLTYAVAAPPAAAVELAEPDVAPRTTRSSVKKVSQTQARNTKRAKKAKETVASLEAHASTVSSDEVSDSFFLVSFSYTPSLTYSFPSDFNEEIRHLGH
jgi:hypothetical protein